MIPMPANLRVWLATGVTDMRKGMNGLALLVQEGLKRDPHAGDLYVFRGRSGSLVKILWHDGLGLSLYAKRLDRGLHRMGTTQGEGARVIVEPRIRGFICTTAHPVGCAMNVHGQVRHVTHASGFRAFP
jgi:transposase